MVGEPREVADDSTSRDVDEMRGRRLGDMSLGQRK